MKTVLLHPIAIILESMPAALTCTHIRTLIQEIPARMWVRYSLPMEGREMADSFTRTDKYRRSKGELKPFSN